jgi:C-terminal processing protease CtpA/Prc
MKHVALLSLVWALSGTASPPPPAVVETQRLASLGRVWGFLKYFHPGVATGSLDWDSVLVAAVPRVKSARTSKDFDLVLMSLIDAAGDVKPCSSCQSAAPDSTRLNIALRWLTDSSLFSAAISRRLEYVRDNRHVGSSRYVTFGVTPLFLADTGDIRTPYPTEGGRLLALFRFWNAIRYYYPYLYVNGGDWTSVLDEFIPRVIAAPDARQFQLTIRELSTRLHDSHVETLGAQISRELGVRVPPFDARSIEGQIVVWRLTPSAVGADSAAVHVGDVITHIDGEPVAKRRSALTKYVAASNAASLEFKLIATILQARAESVTYVIERDGDTLTRRLPSYWRRREPLRPLNEAALVLPRTNVGYINVGGLDDARVDSAVAIVRNTDGLVVDLRRYPQSGLWRLIERLFPTLRPFAKATFADSTYPGKMVWARPALVGPRNPNVNYFRGRLAILVDEGTMSSGEYAAMALRTASENSVIGSQTAGADGNLNSIKLPGAMTVFFTGLGIYYPDGRQTQRVGIQPDIEIRPSLAGLRAGRDEVLDRAIQYIHTGR